MLSRVLQTKAGQLRDIEESFNNPTEVGQTKASLDIQKMIKDINYNYRDKKNRGDYVVMVVKRIILYLGLLLNT